LQNEFNSLRTLLTTIAETAEFNGKNLIIARATDLQVLSTIQGSTVTVAAQSLDPKTLLVHTATLATENSTRQAIVIIDSAITSVVNSLDSIRFMAKRVDIQASFTSKLMDIMKQGVGNLVDADLAEGSANLQAIQIKQELGVQALEIANGSPRSVLALFQ
jgi:flagellin